MTHVDWHPYPETKPQPYVPCLVTIKLQYKRIVGYDYLTPNGDWWKNRDNEVIAWAELPEPYCPKEPEDNHPDAITARKYMAGDPDTVKALHIFDE